MMTNSVGQKVSKKQTAAQLGQEKWQSIIWITTACHMFYRMGKTNAVCNSVHHFFKTHL